MPKSNAAKQADYRERKRAEEEQQARDEELAEALEEQAIRDRWGYAASENRSRAERAATAARILARASDAG